MGIKVNKRQTKLGSGGRRHVRAPLTVFSDHDSDAEFRPSQTCEYCKTQANDGSDPHLFQPYEAGGTMQASRNSRGRFGAPAIQGASGCLRYDEGVHAGYGDGAPTIDRKRNHSVYTLPYASGTEGVGETCRETFHNVLGVGTRLTDTVRKTPATDFVQKSDHSGTVSIHANSIKEQIKRFPRTSSHYAPYSGSYGKERVLSEDLSYAKCWRLWCDQHDKDFAEQAKRLKYWVSLDRIVYAPSEAKLQGEVLLKPCLVYETYRLQFKKYDLRYLFVLAPAFLT